MKIHAYLSDKTDQVEWKSVSKVLRFPGARLELFSYSVRRVHGAHTIYIYIHVYNLFIYCLSENFCCRILKKKSRRKEKLGARISLRPASHSLYMYTLQCAITKAEAVKLIHLHILRTFRTERGRRRRKKERKRKRALYRWYLYDNILLYITSRIALHCIKLYII